MGLLVVMTGCPKTANKAEPKGKVYFSFFDTVSYVYSYANDSDEQFGANCDTVAKTLEEYHHLFDIYYEYTGVNNLCTLNKNAGGEPLKVDQKLIDFLIYAKQLYNLTDGEMNVMMGSVLRPWHDCRTAASTDPQNASIPDMQQLISAAEHTDISSLEIDDENNTVRIVDPDARIDVGALGKGYATEMAAKLLENKGVMSYVLNIGGNIRIIGTKPSGDGWLTGIKNPMDPDSDFALRITISDTSCVTSGSYERFFTVDNAQYHHIIDKDTLMPAEHFTSITVICKDSGLADALSTALFCMSYEDGQALVNSLEGVEVLWIDQSGKQMMTDGFTALIAK
jgi:thiamine biosynthesis lipoprotein